MSSSLQPVPLVQSTKVKISKAKRTVTSVMYGMGSELVGGLVFDAEGNCENWRLAGASIARRARHAAL